MQKSRKHKVCSFIFTNAFTIKSRNIAADTNIMSSERLAKDAFVIRYKAPAAHKPYSAKWEAGKSRAFMGVNPFVLKSSHEELYAIRARAIKKKTRTER